MRKRQVTTLAIALVLGIAVGVPAATALKVRSGPPKVAVNSPQDAQAAVITAGRALYDDLKANGFSIWKYNNRLLYMDDQDFSPNKSYHSLHNPAFSLTDQPEYKGQVLFYTDILVDRHHVDVGDGGTSNPVGNWVVFSPNGDVALVPALSVRAVSTQVQGHDATIPVFPGMTQYESAQEPWYYTSLPTKH